MVQIQSGINVNADTLCSVACPIDRCSDMTGFSNSVSKKTLFAVIGFSDTKISPLMQALSQKNMEFESTNGCRTERVFV